MQEAYATEGSHPYGVQPTGNIYLHEGNSYQIRSNGLGKQFQWLTDELIVEVLSFLNCVDLVHLMKTSTLFYAYCHYSDIWRDLTLRSKNGENIEFFCTWKDTYMNNIYKSKCNSNNSFQPHQPLVVKVCYSDLLHRSWVCRSCDLSAACPGFYKFNDIQRINGESTTIEEFIEKYESRDIPVIVTNSTNQWPAFGKWTKKDYLKSKLLTTQLRATSAAAPLSATFSIEEYFKYSDETKEEAPLYLFERDFVNIAEDLKNDYFVPSFFNSSINKKTDLFHLLGDKKRPDYKWLIIGPPRSGSIFHIDPNQTNAWNVCIKGRKKWIFYPPNTTPPGVESSLDGADVAVPISTGEWLLSFWKYHLEARNNSDVSKRPLETVVEPGEIMFVPHGYWHMVVNLDECIALTHNYVSTSNLSDCLRFLRDKPDQISGVRDREKEGAVQPKVFYSEFIKKLKNVLSDEEYEKYINESFTMDKNDIIKNAFNKTYLFKKKQQNHNKKKLKTIKNNYNISNEVVFSSNSNSLNDSRKIESFSFDFNF
jgi:hypothetical protein